MNQTPATGPLKSRLMTPGPTAVPEAVLLEMAQPIIHHRTKAFRAALSDLSERLQRVFGTTSPVLTLAGSGTTVFEAAQVSLSQPGTKALTIAAGKFGERWQDIYTAYGIEQVKIDLPWGEAVDPQQIAQALADNPGISAVTVVHSETSTATACDIAAIAEVVKKTDALLIVDGITSVAALPLAMDDLGIDVVVAGSQKALMAPPGLGFVALGERARARLDATGPANCYNLDLRKWLKSWHAQDVPFTPPVSLIRGQRVALQMIEDQGLENVWQRTSLLAAATRAAFLAMGLKLVSQSPSDSVSGAYYPDNVDDSTFRATMRDRHGIQIAGGQDGRGGKWSGNIFRISHMGYVDAGDTLATLAAIETELIASGVSINAGSAVAAAAGVLTG